MITKGACKKLVLEVLDAIEEEMERTKLIGLSVNHDAYMVQLRQAREEVLSRYEYLLELPAEIPKEK